LKPLLPIAAPDFTYEFAGRPQASLKGQLGSGVTLLVFYTVPQSLPRLEELAMQQRAYKVAGARVIAVAMGAASTAADARTVPHGESILAIAGDDVAATYAMFARPDGGADDDAPAHVEYLVDRDGYLRVRWIGVPVSAVGRTAEMLNQIGVLFREPPRAPLQWGHRH
jgi:putative copper resistance protein D